MYTPISPTPSLTRKNRSVNLLAECSTVWESAPQSNDWPGVNPPLHYLHFKYYIRVDLCTVSPKLIDKTVQNLNGQNIWATDWSCVDELLEPPPWRHPTRFRTKSWFLNTFRMGFKTFNRVLRGLRPDRTTQSTIWKWSGFSIFFVVHTYSIITICICLRFKSKRGLKQVLFGSELDPVTSQSFGSN